jgi:glyoxylase-like metal-dependent hydrolase (beta-lactamase superfamily II)
LSRRLAIAVATCAIGAVTLGAQQPAVRVFVPDSQITPARYVGTVKLLPVRDSVYVVMGPGGNSTLQVGNDGVLVVDTGTAASAGDLVEAIRGVSQRPVRLVVNTHVHSDHTGGNEVVARAGRFIGGANARPAFTFLGSAAGAPILAFEATLSRMSAAGANAPGAANWPTETFFSTRKDLYLNGESIQLLHYPAAHSDSDAVAYFRRSDVVSTGDLFTPNQFPLIDLEQGGSIAGLLDSINALLELAIPDFNEEGGTLIVPGHGRICDEADLSDYRDMVTIVRDRVQDMVRQKATVAQIKEARLTRDYDGVYAGSGEAFVDAVYRSLTATPAARPGGAR